MKQRKKLVFMIGTAALMFTISGCGKTKLNMTDYFTVEFSGTDGHGTATVNFDEDAFAAALPDEVYDDSSDERILATMGK